MDFADRIDELSKRAIKQKDFLETEEATKNALIMPFISALGYDVFNPVEVVPEFTADHGVKKGEKVDYAIKKDGDLVMLIECKPVGTNLNEVGMSQLYRYFSVTDARIAVLTNGIEFRFYSDLEAPNKMDGRAFLEFDLLHPQDVLVPELKRLRKSEFDEEQVLATAGELKYTNQMKKVLASQLAEPDDDFVEFLGRRVYSGRFTSNVKEQFAEVVRRAFRDFVNEQVNARLESAISHDQYNPESESERTDDGVGDVGGDENNRHAIVTTEEELEGFYIVRAILRENIDVSRIVHRDVKSYFGVLLDDNNRKPICRLHLNGSQWYVGLFDSDDRQEERVPISSLDEIYGLADRLKSTLEHYKEG